MDGSTQLDTHQVGISMNVYSGDNVNLSTQYWPPSSTYPNGAVQFGFHDTSTGQNNPTSIMTSALGRTASHFYNGQTAEVIDERTEIGSNYDKLMFYDTLYGSQWSNAQYYQNGSSSPSAGIRQSPAFWLAMTNVAHTVTLGTAGGPTGVTTQFTDKWAQCGSVEAAVF